MSLCPGNLLRPTATTALVHSRAVSFVPMWDNGLLTADIHCLLVCKLTEAEELPYSHQYRQFPQRTWHTATHLNRNSSSVLDSMALS